MRFRILMAVCCLWWCVPTVSQALTAKEILLLKQKGVSEQTIQMMLQSEMQAKKAASAQKMGVRTITRPDGGSAIVYSTGSDERDSRSREERLKEKRAWEMLQHIIIDTNQKGD